MKLDIGSGPLTRGEAIVVSAMCVVDLFLTGLYAFTAAVRPFTIVTVLVLGGATFGIYVGFRRGDVLTRGRLVSKIESPRSFYSDMALAGAMYVLAVLFCVGLYLQETGRFRLG